MLLGIGAGVGQGVGLVLSKVGMNYYEDAIPQGEKMITELLPFASTFIRAVTGAVGFLCVREYRNDFILWPFHFFFKQPVSIKEIIGACISVLGVSLFFV